MKAEEQLEEELHRPEVEVRRQALSLHPEVPAVLSLPVLQSLPAVLEALLVPSVPGDLGTH